MKSRLTTQKYWEKYYNSSSIGQEHIVRNCKPYDEIIELFIRNCRRTPKTIIEIGAYPGRFLAYWSAKYGLLPTAFDFNSDTTRIKEAFKQMGVHDYRIIQEDFLTYTSNKKYDLVYSLGFIEHFENFDEVMDKHVQMLNPGGVLLIMVPNKRWFRKWYDYVCDFDNLRIHNTKCMSKNVFKFFSNRNNLETVFIGFHGSFVYNVHQELNFFQKLIFALTRRFFLIVNPLIKKHPNRFLSSTLIGIYRKPI